jgi:hypothetical protein
MFGLTRNVRSITPKRLGWKMPGHVPRRRRLRNSVSDQCVARGSSLHGGEQAQIGISGAFQASVAVGE